MPGIQAPQEFPIRKATDPKQVNGRVVNTVRFMEMGGLSGSGKYPGGNTMRVEKPTKVSASKSSTNTSDD